MTYGRYRASSAAHPLGCRVGQTILRAYYGRVIHSCASTSIFASVFDGVQRGELTGRSFVRGPVERWATGLFEIKLEISSA